MTGPRQAPAPSLRWNAWVVVVTVVLGIALGALASGAGAEDAVKRVTTRLYGPFLAALYPATGQQAITVVTIDDDDLNDLDYSWPLGLDYYQRLVDRILAEGPRAIFLDLMFLDRKPAADIARLAGAACRAAGQGVPVFLATVTPAAERGFTEAQLFRATDAAGKPCIHPVAPHVSPDELDQSQWDYAPVPEGQAFDSPALALHCFLRPGQCPADRRAPIAMVWGTAAPEANVRTMVTRVASPSAAGGATYRPLCEQDWHWWQVLPFARVVHDWMAPPLLKLCPYHQVLPVRAFQNQGFDAAQRHAALHGKAVLVGTDLKGIGDRHVSPFHGSLPGVHIHAMALDNLLSFDGRYKRTRDPRWSEATSLPDAFGKTFAFNVLALVLTTATILGFRLWEKDAKKGTAATTWLRERKDWAWFALSFPTMVLFGRPRERRRGDATRFLVKLTVYALVAGAIVWIGYGWLQQGPLAVVGYALFPFVADAALPGDRIAINLRDYLRAFWSDKPWQAWRQSADGADKTGP